MMILNWVIFSYLIISWVCIFLQYSFNYQHDLYLLLLLVIIILQDKMKRVNYLWASDYWLRDFNPFLLQNVATELSFCVSIAWDDSVLVGTLQDLDKDRDILVLESSFLPQLAWRQEWNVLEDWFLL